MLTLELAEQRRGKITASVSHCIMAGWEDSRPSETYPKNLYEWMATQSEKPLVAAASEAMGNKVTGVDNTAAWRAYQFDNPKPTQGLITYAETLACEELFWADPDDYDGSDNKNMQNGNERELEAMEKLAERTGLDFENIGDDQIHISVNGIGATPDGIVKDEFDLIKTGGEAKCRNTLNHARQLLIHDSATLLEHDFHRYCQIQVCIEVCDVDDWYSASFNPLAINEIDSFHYCLIKRDEKFLKVFRKRAAMVFEQKAIFLERIVESRDMRKKLNSIKRAA